MELVIPSCLRLEAGVGATKEAAGRKGIRIKIEEKVREWKEERKAERGKEAETARASAGRVWSPAR